MNTAHKPEMRNLIFAVALSTMVLMGWQLLIEQPRREEAMRQAELMKQQQEKAGDVVLPQPGHDKQAEAVTPKTREERISGASRVKLDTGVLHGSINAAGLRFDDVTLGKYHQTIDDNSPEVVLLSPSGGEDSYLVEFGWLAGSAGVKVPDAQTRWDIKPGELTSQAPLRASWDNGENLRFEQTIRAEGDYMFAIEQQVTNHSDAPVVLHPYGLVSRTYADTAKHYAVLHEGPLGVFNETLSSVEYKALREDGKQTFSSAKGWLGVTDKYWLTAMVPDAAHPFTATMMHYSKDGKDRYQVDYRAEALTIAPGESITLTNRLFAGAKEVSLLDRYSASYNIPLFDRAVDFGRLYFLTKPIFHALNYFYALLGNFGLAIMLLTVCIRVLLFPLANKSYSSMSQLKLLMPKINEIKERYADDKIKTQQEIMEFYRREKVNPASGCLPMLLQLPVFFALYRVLFVTIEMRHAPFFGWIKDLSAPDPTTVFNLFGLIDWTPPHLLMIGAWPLIMAATMAIQQQLNPKPTDPAQAMVMKWLPLMFLFMFASFPAGLVIYWAWNNSLSILQQQVITRRFERKNTND